MAALAAPPLALSAVVWPDSTSAGEDNGAREPFEQLVDDIHTTTVELDGIDYEITLRPQPFGVCLDIGDGINGTSSQCSDFGGLRDLAGLTVFGDGHGAGGLIAVGLVEPEVDAVELELDDEVIAEGVVVELPGRPEEVYVIAASVDEERFNRPGSTVRLLDGDGELIDERSI